MTEAEALWRIHSRELKLAASAVDAADADVRVAGQIPNPQLSLNVQSYSPSTGLGAGGWGDKKLDNILRLEQPIERGGKRDLRIQGAEARREAARFDYAAASQQTRAQLRRAYYDLRLAQDKQRITAEAAELYGRSLAAADKRRQAGDLAPLDVSRLAVDKARADNEARTARSELEQARQVLGYLIGRDDASNLVATDNWPAIADDLPQRRLDDRPDIKAGERRLAAAQSERDLARALRTRDISVGLQYEHNKQNAPTDSFGIGVSIPLFVWHSHEGEIRRAESDLNTAQLQAQQQRALIANQLAQTRSSLLAARDRVQRLEGGSLADAERVAQAAELAYSRGAMGLMDLLDARRTVRQLQLEVATARADYAKAWADWQLQNEPENSQ